MHCRRPAYCALMVTLQQPHSGLIRSQSDSVYFEHAQSIHYCLALNAIPQHVLAMPLYCCEDACDLTVRTLVFLNAVGSLWECCSGVTVVLQDGLVDEDLMETNISNPYLSIQTTNYLQNTLMHLPGALIFFWP